jgi:hypothetical protein
MYLNHNRFKHTSNEMTIYHPHVGKHNHISNKNKMAPDN